MAETAGERRAEDRRFRRTIKKRRPRRHFWLWDGRATTPISAREADRDHHDTDAGGDDEFVVWARSAAEAETGARLWMAARADDATDDMPDGVWLCEREHRVGKSYMTLGVDLPEAGGGQ